jgi:hypothetical protein
LAAKPAKKFATWSGVRPMRPKLSSAHFSAAMRFARRSACERGICQQRQTGAPLSGLGYVIASRFSGAAAKSNRRAIDRAPSRNAGCELGSDTRSPST